MQAASLSGSFSSGRVRCVPRLGAIRGTSVSSRISSGRIRSAQTPVALTTFAASISTVSPLSAQRQVDPLGPAVPLQERGHLEPVGHHRPEALGLAEDRQDEAGVVGLAVVEQVGGLRVPRGQGGDQVHHLRGRDRPVPVGRPVRGVDLTLLAFPPRGPTTPPLPATAAIARHHVVHVQPDPDLAIAAVVAEGRHQIRRRVDEMGGELDHQLSLQQRLADQSEIEVLQVPESAVDHLRRAARGSDRPVGPLDHGDRVTT